MSDSSAALVWAEHHAPTIVILDIGMPNIDGCEAARRLRRMPRLQDVLLIALSGWGQPEHRQRSADAGFDFHLVKPVQLDELESLMSRPSTRRGCRAT